MYKFLPWHQVVCKWITGCVLKKMEWFRFSLPFSLSAPLYACFFSWGCSCRLSGISDGSLFSFLSLSTDALWGRVRTLLLKRHVFVVNARNTFVLVGYIISLYIIKGKTKCFVWENSWRRRGLGTNSLHEKCNGYVIYKYVRCRRVRYLLRTKKKRP